MDHSTRHRLAKGICSRVVGKYPGQVVLCGLYGSTARGDDTEWSDIEMYFVTKKGCRLRTRHFIFNDVQVYAGAITENTLLGILGAPSYKWAFWMGVLDVTETLHGESKKVKAWMAVGKAVPEAKFKKALSEILSDDELVESYGRIMSCRERGNARDAHLAVVEVLYEMRNALCLLNRGWVMHDYYNGLEDTFRFAKLPRGWKSIVPRIWAARDLDEVAHLAERLMESFMELMAKEGIERHVYRELSEIPL
ncbi:MAG: nucleotidyltransferase domain-containing protein [Euryarchaeota archaeon]|nr:nucleotidyltransferase domain-containing protein [Euryarchaeota archaeon]